MGLHNKIALLAGSSISLLWMTGVTPVQAQDVHPNGEELDDIVVYGTSVAEDALAPTIGYVPTETASAGRIGLPIDETPRSVSVVSSQQIEDQGATTLVDAISYSAGVFPAIYGFDNRYDSYTIRGFESGVGGVHYRDGMPLRIFLWSGWNIEPFGVERVEVLRGPSSDLYGANQPGGLVNTVTKRPQKDFAVKLQTALSSHNQKEIAADVTGSLSEGSPISYRFVGVAHTGETQVDNVDDDRLYFAPSVTAELGDSTKLTLLGQFQKDYQGPGWQLLPETGTRKDNPKGNFDYSTFVGDPDRNKLNKDQHYVGYELEHDFTENLKLLQRARLGYSKIDYNSAYNGMGFSLASFALLNPLLPGWGVTPDLTDKNPDHALLVKHVVDEEGVQGTIDTALTYDADFGAVESQFLVGLDYYRGSSETNVVNGLGGIINLYSGDLLKFPAGVPNPLAGFPDVIGYDKQEITQTGLYAVANSKVFDNFRVDLSVRNDWLSLDRESLSTARANPADLTTVKDKSNHSELSGRIGVSYVSDFGLTPYASYGNSFEAPPAGVDSSGEFFKPVTAQQFEVGIKYAPESFYGYFSLSAFHIKKENAVIDNSTTSDPFDRIQAGEVESKGFEFEGAIELLDGLSAIGSYTYLDTEVTKNVNVGLLGKNLERAPEHSGSLWLKYDFQQDWLEGLSVAAGARYIGERYADSANAISLDPVTLFDGALSYEYNNLELSLTGRNLLDKSFVSHCGRESLSGVLSGAGVPLPNYDAYNCTFGKGRELRLQLSATF